MKFMKKKEHVEKRHIEIEDGFVNEAWPILFGAGVPVTFEEFVEEDGNGTERIMYRVTMTVGEKDWIRLMVKLGIKGFEEPDDK